jgi:hypothetical protein
MAIAAEPRHAKDAVIRVLEGGDNHSGGVRVIGEFHGEFERGGAGGSVKTQNHAVGWCCILHQSQATGVGVTQHIVSGH